MGGQGEEDLCGGQRVAVRLVRAMNGQPERVRQRPKSERVGPGLPAQAEELDGEGRGVDDRVDQPDAALAEGRAEESHFDRGDMRHHHLPAQRLEQSVQRLVDGGCIDELGAPQSMDEDRVPAGHAGEAVSAGSGRRRDAIVHAWICSAANEMISCAAGSSPVVSRSTTQKSVSRQAVDGSGGGVSE